MPFKGSAEFFETALLQRAQHGQFRRRARVRRQPVADHGPLRQHAFFYQRLHGSRAAGNSCVDGRTQHPVVTALLPEFVVSHQRFHLARAVYTCQQLGVDAVGLGTPDWGVYGDDLMALYTVRETLATLNALWELHVTRPLPKFLGRFEGIN